jgi:hypothetical protein
LTNGGQKILQFELSATLRVYGIPEGYVKTAKRLCAGWMGLLVAFAPPPSRRAGPLHWPLGVAIRGSNLLSI